MSLVTKIAGSIVFFGLPQALGFASACHTRKFAPTVYPKLKKPFWAPSTSLLKPIWVLMYALMGVASYLVWRQKIINNVDVKAPLALYCVQLFFNVLWAPLFFRIGSPFLGMCCLLLNLITSAATTASFASISPAAGNLMVPYVAFVFISGYLNKSVWRLNQKSAKSKKAKSNDSDDE